MFTIGICDDRPLCRRLLEALIHLYEEKKNVLFNIYEYSSGEELLEEIEKHGLVFDLLFLDNSIKKTRLVPSLSKGRSRSCTYAPPNLYFLNS